MGGAPPESPHELGIAEQTEDTEQIAETDEAEETEHSENADVTAEVGHLSTWSLGSAQARRGTSKAATLLSGIAGAVWMSNLGAMLGAYWR